MSLHGTSNEYIILCFYGEIRKISTFILFGWKKKVKGKQQQKKQQKNKQQQQQKSTNKKQN